MASIKDLKKRISSVKNTQQTTRAMKMVSAAKLRRSQEAIVSNRPYAREIDRLIRLTSLVPGCDLKSPLFQQPGEVRPREASTALLVLVTSDRGLCGAFNSSVIRRAEKWLSQNRASYASIRMAFLGRKGREYFTRRGVVPAYYSEFGPKAQFEMAQKINDWIIEQYVQDEIHEVKVVYNEFKNAISQEVVVENFLPVDPLHSAQGKELDLEGRETVVAKPDASTVYRRLLEKHFAAQVYRILLESQASEHGARMSAMENATKNAGDMIRNLTLQYNKQRQASITKEILEITSGSEALKG